MINNNPLNIDGNEYHSRPRRTVNWTAKGLKITRLRMLSDVGFPAWDVSYCYGEIDGEEVDVLLPFHQLSKGKWKSEIVEFAKRDKVYAKGLGIFNAVAMLY